MYLKKLIIEGFKSFAQRTEFDFAEGVTAIVGPNGSGKSNVSDALRWVMGEASARELRGAKMEDVIFSGTQVDRAVNFAQVSLVLDNSEHVFPIDFPEVVVTRRVFKSGDSEYEINKRSCRLKDISELFMDTGLGKGGYSVVGQGKIENILSTKSEERRGIFESAAGIAKYKHRKEEAERKLVLIDDNLDRVNDILSEIETRIDPLCAQAEKAKQYLQLRDKLKDTEVNVMLRVIDESRQKLTEVESQSSNVLSQITQVKASIEQKEKTIDSFYQALNDLEAKNAAVTEKTAELNNKKTKLMSQIELKTNTNENLEKQLSVWESDLEKGKEEEQTNTHEEIQRVQEWETMQTQLKELEEKRVQLAEQLADKKEQIASREHALEQAKSDAMEFMRSIADEKAKHTGADMLEKGFVDRKEHVLADVQQKKEQYDAQQKIYEKRALQHQQNYAIYEQAQKQYEEDQKGFILQQQTLEQMNRTLIQKEQELSRADEKAKLLAEMREEGDGYPKAVKAILKARKEKKLAGILDSVGGAVRVNEEYMVAIETALGALVNQIITQTEEDAKAAIDYLKKNDIGRVTFLPLTSVKANRLALLDHLKEEAGYVAVASDLVETADSYRGIIENLLGRTLVVENMDHAIALSKKHGYRFKIVTLDGGVCNVGGSLTGGSSHYKSSVLAGGVYLKKTQQLITDLQQEIVLYQQEKSQIEFEVQKTKLALAKQQESLEDSKKEWEDKDRELSNQRIQLTYLEETLSLAEKELESIANHLDETKDQQKAAQENMQQLLAQKQETEQDIEKLTKQLAEDKQEEERLFKEETQLTIASADQQKDAAVFQKERDRLQKEKQLKQEQMKKIREAMAEAREELARGKTQIEQAQKESALVDEEMERVLKDRVDHSDAKEKMNQSLQEEKEAVAHLRETNETLLENKNQLQEKNIRLTADFDHAVNHLWEEYELSYSDANLLRHDIRLDAAKKTVRECKEAMKQLGSVNVEAIGEYQETKERYDFMKKQVEDLISSKGDLHEIIVNMQRIMKEQFEESFCLINENFSIVFQELFGGGTASLSLEDPNDVLTSNIVIHVQPPGKKLQNINLMSGGEKALSAISLLFAILRMKPTPFCILDEIDAPLDEVNVDGFASYLHQYSKSTQFIMITHRQGTMHKADEIYGVTMQRRGISTVLKMAI